MRGLNRVFIQGRVGAEPELRSSQGGTWVCKVSVCVNRNTKKDGAWQEVPEWFRIVLFGHDAEYVAKYATQGSVLAIEGRLQPNHYTDKNGEKRFELAIVAETVCSILGWKQEGKQEGHGRKREEPPPSEDIPF